MRRWGQIAEAKPDDWYAETAKKVYRPDIYLQAAQAAGRRRQGQGGGLPVRHRRLPGRRPGEFIDGIAYDGRKPNAYLDKFAIGLKGDADGRRRRRQWSDPWQRGTDMSRDRHAGDVPRHSDSAPAADRQRRARRGANRSRRSSAVRRARTGRLGFRAAMRLRAARIRARSCASCGSCSACRCSPSPVPAAVEPLAPRIVRPASGTFPGPARSGHRPARCAADHRAERAQGGRVLRTPGRRATPSCWPRIPTARSRSRSYTGKPTYHRPDLHQPEDGVHRLPARHAGRGAAGHPVRPDRRPCNAALNPLDPDLQAGVAAGLAAHRHMVVSALYVSDDPMFAEILHDLGDHRDAVLAVADADQHRAGRGLHRQGSAQRRPGAASSAGPTKVPSSCCRRRCR